MLTERVNLKSKSLFSQESIDVDLMKPASKNYNAGSIYLMLKYRCNHSVYDAHRDNGYGSKVLCYSTPLHLVNTMRV